MSRLSRTLLPLVARSLLSYDRSLLSYDRSLLVSIAACHERCSLSSPGVGGRGGAGGGGGGGFGGGEEVLEEEEEGVLVKHRIIECVLNRMWSL